MAKMETDWFDKSYDVIFTNGDKLEFDKKRYLDRSELQIQRCTCRCGS